MIYAVFLRAGSRGHEVLPLGAELVPAEDHHNKEVCAGSVKANNFRPDPAMVTSMETARKVADCLLRSPSELLWTGICVPPHVSWLVSAGVGLLGLVFELVWAFAPVEPDLPRPVSVSISLAFCFCLLLAGTALSILRGPLPRILSSFVGRFRRARNNPPDGSPDRWCVHFALGVPSEEKAGVWTGPSAGLAFFSCYASALACHNWQRQVVFPWQARLANGDEHWCLSVEIDAASERLREVDRPEDKIRAILNANPRPTHVVLHASNRCNSRVCRDASGCEVADEFIGMDGVPLGIRCVFVHDFSGFRRFLGRLRRRWVIGRLVGAAAAALALLMLLKSLAPPRVQVRCFPRASQLGAGTEVFSLQTPRGDHAICSLTLTSRGYFGPLSASSATDRVGIEPVVLGYGANLRSDGEVISVLFKPQPQQRVWVLTLKNRAGRSTIVSIIYKAADL